MNNHLSIFILPPLLTLITGLLLSILAVVRGKKAKENLLFSAMCFLTSVPLSVAFLAHFFLSDFNSIMRVEHTVHFAYVFIGYVDMLFFHYILGVRRKWLEYLLLVLSIAFAVLSLTPYYFAGIHNYPWGGIAAAGPAFLAFGAYGMAVLVYGIALCIKRLKKEANQITRSKIRYILFSTDVMILLTITNIPAMSGYNIYPFGNFMFVPLLVMAYGVLRYRLMDVKSIAHLTLSWLALSSLIIIPNYFIFVALSPLLKSGSGFAVVLAVAAWFIANYEYWKWIQPRINRIFNREQVNLLAAEAQYIEDISILKSLNGLISQLQLALMKDLHLSFASVGLLSGVNGELEIEGRDPINLSRDAMAFLSPASEVFERGIVEVDPRFNESRAALMHLFDASGAAALTPISQDNVLIGVLFLGEKANLRPLNKSETRFVEDVRNATATALSNSLLYQSLSDMKDGLERTVQERTKELSTKNEQMMFELKIASRVQRALLPRELPQGQGLHIAARLIPLMEVSGDFYDVIPLGADRVLAAVIDVSGHGIPAALLTSVIKPALEGAAAKSVKPDEIARELNSQLFPLLNDTEFYFTMFLCVIDRAEMSVEYSNCGHVEPVLLRRGSFAKLSSNGVFIGLAADSVFSAKKAKLEEGDRIFVYSDGLTEARSPSGGEFGGQGLLKAVSASASLSPADQAKAIMEEVDAFRDKRAEAKIDDITLMIISLD